MEYDRINFCKVAFLGYRGRAVLRASYSAAAKTLADAGADTVSLSFTTVGDYVEKDKQNASRRASKMAELAGYTWSGEWTDKTGNETSFESRMVRNTNHA